MHRFNACDFVKCLEKGFGDALPSKAAVDAF